MMLKMTLGELASSVRKAFTAVINRGNVPK